MRISFHQDGCNIISQGTCEDQATVYYSQEDLEANTNGIPIKDASLLGSNTNFLALKLTSCLRRLSSMNTENFGISAMVSFSG